MKYSIHNIFEEFDSIRETSLSSPIVKYKDILPLLSKHKKNKNIKIKAAGKSVNGKVIYSVTVGKGALQVLAWSQMHGDESTATRAFFDFLNFIEKKETNKLAAELLDKITLTFIPILNPDGADKQTRYNALGIDINRDAVDPVSPESEILDRIFREIQPGFSLNLHDQDGWYSVENSGKPTSVSFLATTPDCYQTKTAARKKAMSVIGKTFSAMSEIIPGHIARYSDAFEPRAFGDNFAAKDSAVILIEAGRWKDDENKEFIRKIYFTTFTAALLTIASEKYPLSLVKIYNQIPKNSEMMLDLILRNVLLRDKYKVDIGIKRFPVYDERRNKTVYEGKIETLGDLSVYSAFEEYDMNGYSLYPGEKEKHNREIEFTEEYYFNLVKKGITTLEHVDLSFEKNDFNEIPLNLIRAGCDFSQDVYPGNFANFYLKNRNGETDYIVVNGFLVNIISNDISVINAIRI